MTQPTGYGLRVSMISSESPLKRIPRNLGIKDAFYLDGLRHAAEICDVAFKRLTSNLRDTVQKQEENLIPSSFSSVFLDAWAFVDSADRFRCLQNMREKHLQKNSRTKLPTLNLNEVLRDISTIRNVSAHIAERADHVISINGAALGSLSWVTMTSESPMKAKTCIIRPGYINGEFKSHLPMPAGEHIFVNSCTSVRLHAGNGRASLSNTYFSLARSIIAIETELSADFTRNDYGSPCHSDVFASAELDFSGLDNANSSHATEP
jgi:hypothetical protein